MKCVKTVAYNCFHQSLIQFKKRKDICQKNWLQRFPYLNWLQKPVLMSHLFKKHSIKIFFPLKSVFLQKFDYGQLILASRVIGGILSEMSLDEFRWPSGNFLKVPLLKQVTLIWQVIRASGVIPLTSLV